MPRDFTSSGTNGGLQIADMEVTMKVSLSTPASLHNIACNTRLPAMVQKISETMKILPERVSIKATTAERLGFIGREEGIASQAVVLLKHKKDI